jgi:hypothetical protein
VLGQKPVEPAEAELVPDVRLERGEIEGGRPGEAGAQVQRPDLSQQLGQRAAVAGDEPERPRKVHGDAQLVAPRIVQRLGQDERLAIVASPGRDRGW